MFRTIRQTNMLFIYEYLKNRTKKLIFLTMQIFSLYKTNTYTKQTIKIIATCKLIDETTQIFPKKRTNISYRAHISSK